MKRFIKEWKDHVRENCDESARFLQEQVERFDDETIREIFLDYTIEYFNCDADLHRYMRELIQAYLNDMGRHDTLEVFTGEVVTRSELQECLDWSKRKEADSFRSFVLVMERYIGELKPEEAAWVLELRNKYIGNSETSMEL